MHYRGDVTLKDINLITALIRSESVHLAWPYSSKATDAEVREKVAVAIAEHGIIPFVNDLNKTAPLEPRVYELVERYRSAPTLPQRDLLRALLRHTSGTAYDAWLGAAARAERMICAIRDDKGHKGTGFLIAGDLILTALHVLHQCSSISNVRLVFDRLMYLGCNLDPGIEVKLATDTLDRANTKLAALDIVVLRTDQSVGTTQIGAAQEQRSWFYLPDLAATAVVQNDIVSLLHRPSAASYFVAFGSFDTPSRTGESFLYDADSDPGSSGAPVVSSQSWDVLGVHVEELAHKPPNRRAVTGGVIRTIIESEENMSLPPPPVVLLRE